MEFSMHILRPLAASVALAGLIGISSAASAASTECATYPKVAWWGKLSHESVQRYVERKHKGDWASYLKKWERQLKLVEDVHNRDSAIVIRKKGLRLKGEELAAYVQQVKERVEVTRCLAEVQGLTNFSTAAGGNDDKPKAKTK